MLAKDIKIGDKLRATKDCYGFLKKGNVVTVKEIDKSERITKIWVIEDDDILAALVSTRNFEKVIE